jgi:hypothetical protein
MKKLTLPSLSAILPISLLVSCIFISACSTPTPWVKPYERAHLADPLMDFNRDPVSASYLHHVYDAREGARGAGIATGGGCGCN